jgi:hypothetical protein
MGMGYWANQAYVISEEVLRKVCKKEYNALINLLKKLDIDVEGYNGQILAQEEYEELTNSNDEPLTKENANKVGEVIQELQNAFNKSSNLGLHINYQSEDEGSRYDDVEGLFWEVYGFTGVTTEGQAFIDKFGENSIINASWASFG